MKVKLKTPQHSIVGFSRRELVIISNCLNEACYGLLMDRFIPAHDELAKLLDGFRGLRVDDMFKLKTRV